MQKVTFREVHADLEKEAMLLQVNHNIEDFKHKASVLSSMGFTNSIATKLYKGIADNQSLISDYNQIYGANSKFIIDPQLERLCEKYDLYVRSVNLFLGDIPEKNINDIMRFKVRLKDVFSSDELSVLRTTRYIFDCAYHGLGYKYVDLSELMQIKQISRRDPSWNPLVIAAVKSLFSPIAFQESNARILHNTNELEAKNQVEMDPIVLLKVHGGYLIITAWGDEANDELVINQKLN